METQRRLNGQIQIGSVLDRLQDHRTIDIALADGNEVIAVVPGFDILQVDMAAAGKSNQGVFCRINLSAAMYEHQRFER